MNAPNGRAGSIPRPFVILLLVAWTVLVWQLLTNPRVSTEPWFPWMPYVRNFGHAVLFGVQALLIGLALRPGPVGRPLAVWLAAATLALAYGGLTEWRQSALPGRTASWIDVATDAVGAYGLPWALAEGFRISGRALIVLALAVLFSVAATLS